MKASIAALTLCSALAAAPAWAQSPRQNPDAKTPISESSNSNSTPASGEKPGPAAKSESPKSAPGEAVKAPASVKVPDESIEPYLLNKENGPFMVMAKTFRGPDSEKMALALCKELRDDFGLPSYILRTGDLANLAGGVRVHDEAAVLVGNEKTLAATDTLLKQVKKLHPKCLQQMKPLFSWNGAGTLSRALRTTNPLYAAQRIRAAL